MKEYRSRYCDRCGKEVDDKKDQSYLVAFKQEAWKILDLKIYCKGSIDKEGCYIKKTINGLSTRDYTYDVFARLYEDYFMPDHIAEKFLFYKGKVDREFACVFSVLKLSLKQFTQHWWHDNYYNVLYLVDVENKDAYKIVVNEISSAESTLNSFASLKSNISNKLTILELGECLKKLYFDKKHKFYVDEKYINAAVLLNNKEIVGRKIEKDNNA